MKVITIQYLVLLFYSISFALCNEDNTADSILPDPLTVVNFKKQIKNGELHLVEFFSPYCSHCSALKPIWEEFYNKTNDILPKFNIHQVNCIESGDLCNDEDIDYYPKLKLYGPMGHIKNYPLELENTLDNLMDFAEKQLLDKTNFDKKIIKSTSKFLTGSKLNQLIIKNNERNSEAKKETYLISFWPSKNMKSTDDNVDFENCDDCKPFQRVWNYVSKDLLKENIITAHINCESNEKICEDLGFDDLVTLKNPMDNRSPKVALLLPDVNELIIYENEHSIDDIKRFVKNSIKNDEMPEIFPGQIAGIVKNNYDYLSKGAIDKENLHLIFINDEIDNDYGLLIEKLLQPLSKIKSINLYKADSSILQEAYDSLKDMFSLINYNRSEPEKIMNEKYFQLNKLTSYPSFMLVKDGDLIPYFYQYNGNIEDINEKDFLQDLISWINKMSMPLLSELTNKNLKQYLKFHNEYYSHLAIQVVDSSDRKSISHSKEYINNFILASYDYEHLNMKKIVNSIFSNGEDIQEDFENSEYDKLLEKVDIPSMFRKEDNRKILLTYLDIGKNAKFLKTHGLNLGGENYKNGDVVIIDKSTHFFYNHDPLDDILTTFHSPYRLKESFVSLNTPEFSSISVKMKGRLVKSPFPSQLRYLDYLYQSNITLFVMFIFFVIIIVKGISIYRRSRLNNNYKAKRNTVGLLGRRNKKQSQD